jgi:HD-GYP domain-containing protein (c-di-GMP phosphodiesterase class II)
VFVCDAYAAMTRDRYYQPAMSHADALAELRRRGGTQFAPGVVDAFLQMRAAHSVAAA